MSRIICAPVPAQARKALAEQEVPIGCAIIWVQAVTLSLASRLWLPCVLKLCRMHSCVIVRGDAIVASGRNMTNHSRNVRFQSCSVSSLRSLQPSLLRGAVLLLQATRHAEFEAIDALLSACGGDPKAAAFTEYALQPANMMKRTWQPCSSAPQRVAA